jgi:hypothetical protein
VLGFLKPSHTHDGREKSSCRLNGRIILSDWENVTGFLSGNVGITVWFSEKMAYLLLAS